MATRDRHSPILIAISWQALGRVLTPSTDYWRAIGLSGKRTSPERRMDGTGVEGVMSADS